MEQLEHPDFEIWEERKGWFENELENKQHPMASYLVSDQGTALLVELQSCYCAGAFLAVIILSVSIIDAQLRETEAMDNKIGTAKLLDEYFTGKDINWLRKLRNKYVHVDIDNSALTIDDQYNNRKQMESDARRAIQMVIHAFFQSPGT
ncbi:MAG: hypothetical protein IPN43_11180 [Chitinophagaceae bacterium]|nr:hypothetical protein [Chitinophagaceae bacterium]